jgi:ADP-dependent NAD(P)H-hydrate dehydratase / NAD(P)H-hydrate epimerase
MQKILSSQQIKKLDQFTIEHERIASIELMERASRAFFDWFCLKFLPPQKIAVVCGTGNNGGDGLAIARMLAEVGYSINVFLVKGEMPESPDFQMNLARLDSKISKTELRQSSELVLSEFDVVIDAIFGSGLSRPASGWYAEVTKIINNSKANVVAVDIPSGLMMDAHSEGAIVQADYTVSFQLPKLAFLMPENAKYVGEWTTVDIKLSTSFIKQSDCKHFLVDRKAASKSLKPRKKFSHKGSYGHALLVAGGLGKMGAAVLGAKAVMRSGAGLLTVLSPKCGYEILQTSVPEAMVEIGGLDFLEYVLDVLSYQSIGIGPGIGKQDKTKEVLKSILHSYQKPIVLDADALNILSENHELLERVPQGSILTPHPKEFERLVGAWSDDFARLEKQQHLAKQVNSVIVLKGAFSSIASPDGNVYFNSTGNPGMATGGSGDVLTGILTGLLAQGYAPLDAAILGVYLHGLAGDLAAYELGMDSVVASDLVHYLPGAFKRVKP